jgi:hypothetical protein
LINIFIINVFFLYAGDGEYAVSKISAALMKNANAVLRFEEIKFEIHSAKEAIETNHYVITILNENGDKWAEFAEYYDKLREINSMEGYLYDANGKQLKKMKAAWWKIIALRAIIFTIVFIHILSSIQSKSVIITQCFSPTGFPPVVKNYQ